MSARISSQNASVSSVPRPDPASATRPQDTPREAVAPSATVATTSPDEVERSGRAGTAFGDFSDAATPHSSATTQSVDPAQRSLRKEPVRGLADRGPDGVQQDAAARDEPVAVTSQIRTRARQQSEIRLGEPSLRANYEFRGARQDAREFPARVGDHRFSIVVPDGPRAAEQARDVARSFSTLSPSSLRHVDRVVVNPVRNPEDEFWARQYNMPNFESALTAGRSGTIHTYPRVNGRLESIGPSLAHEIGHIASKRAWGENYSNANWRRWSEAGRADGTSPSDYATRSPGEDFAETYALYIRTQGTRQHDEFRQQFPRRFAIIDAMGSG